MPLFEQIPMHKTSTFNFLYAGFEPQNKFIKSYHHCLTDFLPSHTHDFYEINIVCEGVGKHLLGDREILTGAGDVFVIPPNVQHGYSCNGDMTVFHILLSGTFISTFSAILEKMQGYTMLFSIEPIFRQHTESTYYLSSRDIPFKILKQYIDLIDSKQTSSEEARVAHLLSLIATLSSHIHSLKPINIENLPNSKVITVLKSMEYIENNFSSDIDFERLCFDNAISYSTFLRYFKSISKTTPAKYQMKCKIKNASNLLISTNESILSVALCCGFYDSSHFIKAFIKEKGCPPTEFRRLNKA